MIIVRFEITHRILNCRQLVTEKERKKWRIIMNLSKFLTTVDSYTKDMSHVELEAFIHQMARILQEEKRTDFIDMLKKTKNITQSNTIGIMLENQTKQSLLEQLNNITKEIEKIEAGDICLVGELNEEYDDWYEDEEPYLFEDPENVLGILDNAISLIHQCVDNEVYKESYELVDKLVYLLVYVVGTYEEYCGDDLSLRDLNSQKLLQSNFSQFALDALYVAYMGNKLEERPDIMYSMMKQLNSMSLENVLQHGKDELEQLEEFLPLWIEYLSNLSERYAEQLLLEAHSLLNNEEKLLENARKYVKQHPALYKQYLLQKSSKENVEKSFEVGLEALNTISNTYIIRSSIALLTSDYALQMQKIEEAEQCWLEAFYSNTTAINYMRLYLECKDYAKYKETVRNFYYQLYQRRNVNSISFVSKELSENYINQNRYCTLLFLDGQWEELINIHMNVREPLGWSMTFMKQGIALFLLSLFHGNELPIGLRKMAELAMEEFNFSVKEYQKGLHRSIEEDDLSFFWNCFCAWNRKQNCSEKVQSEILTKLEQWISYRVKGIMQANRRGYYDECAAFVAALGEVKEYRKEPLGKQNFMEMYKKEYSRRTSFHQELYKFGLKK